LISRKRNQPTRLAVVDLVASTPPALLDVVSAVARALASESPCGEAATSSLRYRLEGALLETFVSEASWGPLLQTPRAVSRAVAAIEEGAVFDPERLAAVSGVTARTLREGFVAVFGMSLTAYLQRARLERARQSLASGYDSRSIPQVGKESGFSTAPAFTRAYVRAFGESPSETRARAVHASPLTAGRGSVPA
jgi:AraC-like DNA-binding protein